MERKGKWKTDDFYYRVSGLLEDILFEYRFFEDKLVFSEEYRKEFGENQILETRIKSILIDNLQEMVKRGTEGNVRQIDCALPALRGLRRYRVISAIVFGEDKEPVSGIGRIQCMETEGTKEKKKTADSQIK